MATPSYRFDDVELFPVERRLEVRGEPIALGARAFDVLLALIERRDRLVARDELLDAVWPDVAVEPNNLAVQVGALRKALGPHVIATIPGRGYRFSVVVDEVARHTPAVDREPLRTNLPTALPALVGRADALREVDALIAEHRLVTVTGAGGIGKTRLAQHVLHGLRDTPRHGVCWIELAPSSDPSSLPGTIAAAIGIPSGGADAASLVAAMAPLEMLVAFDNAEHLLADLGRLVESLLVAAPHVRLLVTSQAPLHARHEQVYRLGALSVPHAQATTAEALEHGAVRLFAARAQAADSRFRVHEANVAGVIRLCAQLDGLPLAIEFAAARAPLLGVDRVAESLEQRLELLKGGHRFAPARHRTLRAALEWSHRLLGREERIVFRRLAVIAGSASLDVVQAIVTDDGSMPADDGPPLDRWAALDALGALVDRSLVTIALDGRDPNAPRYRLLETPRAYATERLHASGEAERLQARHAAAIAALLEAAWVERWSGRVGYRDWIETVDEDRDNARAAFVWARRHDAFPLILAMAPVLLTRALFGATYDERAVVAGTLEQGLSTRPVEPDQLTARVQLMRFWTERELPRALDEAARALSIAEARGDRFACYLLHGWLVRAHAQRRDLDAAAASLAHVEALEDPDWPAIRRWVGADARSIHRLVQGPPAAALDCVRDELRIVRLAGDTGDLTAATLIDAELMAGHAEAAAAHAKALLLALGDTRDALSRLVVRINLTAALLAQDAVDEARPVAAEAWRMSRHFALQGDCAAYLALICALERRWGPAAALIAYAEGVYRERGAPPWISEAKAIERAVALTEARLGSSAFERLKRTYAKLAEADVEALAFDTARAPDAPAGD